MAIAILLLVLILFLIGWASYGISLVAHKRLVKAGNRNANLIRAVVAIASFFLILGVVVVLFLFNVRIER